MSTHNNEQTILTFITAKIDYIFSLFMTGFYAKAFWPEIVHGVASIVTALLIVIVVFFAKRVLKKYFPD